MKNWNFYRLLLRLVPGGGEVNASTLAPADARAAAEVFRRHRCLGAALCLFDAENITGELYYGASHRDGTAVTAETAFRAASVSKFVTALGAMKLWEEGRIDLDADAGAYLPFPLRHPSAPEAPVTLRALLTHTAGLRDSAGYNAGIARGAALSGILRDPQAWAGTPGAWEYSNLGAGIAGVVMEAAADTDFEELMQETVFQPLGVTATYYPQKVRGDLADACRVLPARKTPNYDAAARRARPLPPMEVNAEAHYNLAHGSLCLTARELARLGQAGMAPGFLSLDSLAELRRFAASFGERAGNLSQGIGTFILRDPALSARALFGHQGMAYGAVHGLFFDPETKKGVSLLTTGASEARRGVLADLNAAVLALFMGEKHA